MHLPRPASRPTLRTELLVNVAILATAAVLLAVGSIVLLYDAAEPERAALYICILVAAEVGALAAFGAVKLNRRFIEPVRRVAAAAEEIADGDDGRRVEPQHSRELHLLASSVNRMAGRLLHERTQLARSGSARAIPESAPAGPPVPIPIDVNDTLRRVVDRLSAGGMLRRVSLIMELANEGPFVHGEALDLEEVFVSLLRNAADAVAQTGVVAIRTTCMPSETLEAGATRRASDSRLTLVPHPPGPRVKRWLGGEGGPSWVVKIVVADSGPGVPEELRERIFDPLPEAGGADAAGPAAGSALATVARIVESLGGIAWVGRAREGGAAVHVLLPLAQASFALDDPAIIPREFQA